MYGEIWGRSGKTVLENPQGIGVLQWEVCRNPANLGWTNNRSPGCSLSVTRLGNPPGSEHWPFLWALSTCLLSIHRPGNGHQHASFSMHTFIKVLHSPCLSFEFGGWNWILVLNLVLDFLSFLYIACWKRETSPSYSLYEPWHKAVAVKW